VVTVMNKQRFKSFFCLVLAGGLLLSLTGCFQKGYLSKKEIFHLVNTHKESLLSCITQNDFTPLAQIEPLLEAKVMADGVVDFYCGGKGLSVSGVDYGFYYSPENLPLTCHSYDGSGLHGSLTPKGKGFEGKNYYTEKIQDHFYYYEARF
jgi:hypothetical protein